jgi:hypothetical protein
VGINFLPKLNFMATITCAHCGGMFQIQLNMGTTGRGSRGYQHSSSQGCGKMTNVEVHNGLIVKTWKG